MLELHNKLVSGSNAADTLGAESEGITGGWGSSTATSASGGWGSTKTCNPGDEAAKAEGEWGSSTTTSGWSSSTKDASPGKILSI